MKSNLKLFMLQNNMLRSIVNADYNILNHCMKTVHIYDYHLAYSFRFSLDDHINFLVTISELTKRKPAIHTGHTDE